MKRHCVLVLLLSALLLLPSCTSVNKTESGSATKDLKLAFVTNNNSDFWTIARKGMEKADNELPDVSAEFKINSDGTTAEQKRIIDDLLTRGVNGIAISPVDRADSD